MNNYETMRNLKLKISAICTLYCVEQSDKLYCIVFGSQTKERIRRLSGDLTLSSRTQTLNYPECGVVPFLCMAFSFLLNFKLIVLHNFVQNVLAGFYSSLHSVWYLIKYKNIIVAKFPWFAKNLNLVFWCQYLNLDLSLDEGEFVNIQSLFWDNSQ